VPFSRGAHPYREINVTDNDFVEFVLAYRAEMGSAGQNPRMLKVGRDKTRASLPMPGGRLFTIDRKHLEGLGTPTEVAKAVHGEYLDEVQRAS
jgi:hypothetical protein